MIVRKLRLQRGWSQDQLAQMSGLNIRTIQRIERGQKASLESLKSLAAVFEIDINDIAPEASMNSIETLTQTEAPTATPSPEEEQRVIEHVQDIKAFYTHLTTYAVTIFGLLILNLIVTPGYLWVKWAAFGWGIGVISHGLSTFEVLNFFGPEWEKKQIEKRLGKKL